MLILQLGVPNALEFQWALVVLMRLSLRQKNLLKAASDFCFFLEASIDKGRRGPMHFLNTEN